MHSPPRYGAESLHDGIPSPLHFPRRKARSSHNLPLSRIRIVQGSHIFENHKISNIFPKNKVKLNFQDTKVGETPKFSKSRVSRTLQRSTVPTLLVSRLEKKLIDFTKTRETGTSLVLDGVMNKKKRRKHPANKTGPKNREVLRNVHNKIYNSFQSSLLGVILLLPLPFNPIPMFTYFGLLGAIQLGLGLLFRYETFV